MRDAVWEAKYMGFDGKLTLHPDQVSGAHRAFEPTDEELEDAEAISSVWEDDGGKGSLEHKGKRIDAPHYARAKKVTTWTWSTKKECVQKKSQSSAEDRAEEIKATFSTGNARPAPAHRVKKKRTKSSLACTSGSTTRT
ncbi:hypothetical protein ACHAWF_014844 [Thalassiosira exigua]